MLPWCGQQRTSVGSISCSFYRHGKHYPAFPLTGLYTERFHMASLGWGNAVFHSTRMPYPLHFIMYGAIALFTAITIRIPRNVFWLMSFNFHQLLLDAYEAVTFEYVKVSLSAAWPVYICLWIHGRLVFYCKPLSIWYVCDTMSLCSFCFTYCFTCCYLQTAEMSFHIQINCLQNVWRVCALFVWGVLSVCVLLFLLFVCCFFFLKTWGCWGVLFVWCCCLLVWFFV